MDVRKSSAKNRKSFGNVVFLPWRVRSYISIFAVNPIDDLDGVGLRRAASVTPFTHRSWFVRVRAADDICATRPNRVRGRGVSQRSRNVRRTKLLITSSPSFVGSWVPTPCVKSRDTRADCWRLHPIPTEHEHKVRRGQCERGRHARPPTQGRRTPPEIVIGRGKSGDRYVFSVSRFPFCPRPNGMI